MYYLTSYQRTTYKSGPEDCVEYKFNTYEEAKQKSIELIKKGEQLDSTKYKSYFIGISCRLDNSRLIGLSHSWKVLDTERFLKQI